MYPGAQNLGTNDYRAQAEQALGFCEQSAIAVLPSRGGRKGSYVGGWPDMPVGEAIATTRRDLAAKPINLAARTGDGTAVFDLDAKNGVDPGEMLQLLRRLVGPAIMAIVRTSRGFHIWVQVTGPVGNGFCSFIGGEIFSDPHLAMLPPSVHPSGHQYTWEVEPRDPEAAANLRSLGLVPDNPARAESRSAGGEGRPMTSAPAYTQRDFARLMSEAGVRRGSIGPQTLERCPWHDDRSPSLSVNWEAAVFCCFSEHCRARGGIGRLRRRVGGDTPSYRQWSDVENTSLHHREGDHLSGDKLGCSDVDAAAARLAGGLQELGLDERAASVRDCRATFRVGKCRSCARTPAFPISCSHPLCIRCMPGRLAADWARHRASLPAKVAVALLRPRGVVVGSPGVLRTVRSRFAEWRRRAGVSAGTSRASTASGFMAALPHSMILPAIHPSLPRGQSIHPNLPRGRSPSTPIVMASFLPSLAAMTPTDMGSRRSARQAPAG
jgi:hypothetical protein